MKPLSEMVIERDISIKSTHQFALKPQKERTHNNKGIATR
jgi:hypothetical protein